MAPRRKVAHSTKAGLIISVGRLHRFLRQGRYSARTSVNAAVFLAGVLQSVARVIFQEAIKAAGGSRITPKILNIVIKSHGDLDHLFGHADFASGGVVPFIHPSVLHVKKPKVSQFDEAILQPGTKLFHGQIRGLGRPTISAHEIRKYHGKEGGKEDEPDKVERKEKEEKEEVSETRSAKARSKARPKARSKSRSKAKRSASSSSSKNSRESKLRSKSSGKSKSKSAPRPAKQTKRGRKKNK